MKTIKVFNIQEKPDVSLLKYDAGWVYKDCDEFLSPMSKQELKILLV